MQQCCKITVSLEIDVPADQIVDPFGEVVPIVGSDPNEVDIIPSFHLPDDASIGPLVNGGNHRYHVIQHSSGTFDERVAVNFHRRDFVDEDDIDIGSPQRARAISVNPSTFTRYLST